MDSPRIILISQPSSGSSHVWTGSAHVRVGRLPDWEVVLDDPSVSRRHAELCLADEGWVVRDLGSSNGTFLNDVRIGRTGQRVRQGDAVRLGQVELRVDVLRGSATRLRAAGQVVEVEAAADRTWDEALDAFEPTDDEWKRRGKAFLRLMRSGYRLARPGTTEDAVHGVLAEAVGYFGAQRGGVFLADDATAPLNLVGLVAADGVTGRPSKTLATRALRGGRSLLFKDCQEDSALRAAESIGRGAVSSIICAVLRSPERSFGVLHLDRGLLQDPFTEADLYLADSLAVAVALGLERQHLLDRQHRMLLQTVTALAQAVELRDQYTGNHTHRVTAYAVLLAEELGLDAEQRRQIDVATPLHDIGKIAVDDAILRKAGRLTPAEYDCMKGHVTRGAEIVQMVPGLAFALPVVRSHHERWDGRGYPDGTAGEATPLAARIVAVADAFDAMTSDRPYRSGRSVEAAYAELMAGSGTHFDPACVAAFVRLRPRVEAMLAHETDERQKTAVGTDTVPRHLVTRVLPETAGG